MEKIKQRFEEKYVPVPECGCWIWTGHCNNKGYGRINISRRVQYAHRIAWELYNEPIPEGTWVLHHCDTPCCVNPRHLFLGDNSINMRDSWKKGRLKMPRPNVKGENHGRSKLTAEQVRRIRKDNRTQQAIANDYHIDRRYVGTLKSRITWRHIED